MAGKILGGKKTLSDPEEAKRLVPALSWDKTRQGSSAIKRVPTYMAKRLDGKQRENFGDMLDGGDRAAAMDSKTAASIAAQAGPVKVGHDSGEFL